MIDTIVAKAKGFILNPVETFQASRDDAAGAVFSYLGRLLLINAILSGIIGGITVTAMGALGMYSGMIPGFAMLMPVAAMGVPVVVFFEILIGGIIFTIIAGAWIHLWVYILGGRNSIMQTMKAFAYGMTPSLLLGWIPMVGILFAVWSFILDILGIRELAGISIGKAALAMIIATLIPLLIMVIMYVFYVMPHMSSSSLVVPRTGY